MRKTTQQEFNDLREAWLDLVWELAEALRLPQFLAWLDALLREKLDRGGRSDD